MMKRRSKYLALAMALTLTSCASATSTADTASNSTEATAITTPSEANTEEGTTEGTTEETTISETTIPSTTEKPTKPIKETTVEETTEKETETETEAETKEPEQPSTEETTEEETSIAPTTEAPTTEAPATTVPTTEAPATKAPETTEPTTSVTPTTTESVKPVSIEAKVTSGHHIGDVLTGADFTITVKMSDGSELVNPPGWAAAPLELTSSSNLINLTYDSVSTSIEVKAEKKPEPTSAEPTQPVETKPVETKPVETTEDWEASWQASWEAAWATDVNNPEYRSPDEIYVFDSDIDTCIKQAGIYAFERQNQLRAEKGIAPLKWSDEIYEYGVKGAAVLGKVYETDGWDALNTKPHTRIDAITKIKVLGVSGNEYDIGIGNNLSFASFDISEIGNYRRQRWAMEAFADSLSKSPGHKDYVYDTMYDVGAVAIYFARSNTGSKVAVAVFMYWNTEEYKNW